MFVLFSFERNQKIGIEDDIFLNDFKRLLPQATVESVNILPMMRGTSETRLVDRSLEGKVPLESAEFFLRVNMEPGIFR